jgi:hypothetical protein
MERAVANELRVAGYRDAEGITRDLARFAFQLTEATGKSVAHHEFRTVGEARNAGARDL